MIKKICKIIEEWEDQEIYLNLGWYQITTNNITMILLILISIFLGLIINR